VTILDEIYCMCGYFNTSASGLFEHLLITPDCIDQWCPTSRSQSTGRLRTTHEATARLLKKNFFSRVPSKNFFAEATWPSTRHCDFSVTSNDGGILQLPVTYRANRIKWSAGYWD